MKQLLFIAVALLLTLGACTPTSTYGQACNKNPDCPAGQYCREGYCNKGGDANTVIGDAARTDNAAEPDHGPHDAHFDVADLDAHALDTVASDTQAQGDVDPCDPLHTCGSTCIDTQSNFENCGACNAECNAVFGNRVDVCVNGSCGCAANVNLACPIGELCSSSGCNCPSGVVCAGSCCSVGDNCIGQVCCSPNNSCASQCCTALQSCVGGTTCCTSANICGDNCCNASETCVNSACCASSLLCGSQCCQAGNTCVAGACCADSNVCASSCCSGNQTCVSGTCCGAASVCGENCCNSDETCVNTSCCPLQRTCGETCCPVGNFCLDGTSCGLIGDGETIIYATADMHDGNLGGRSGADAFCTVNKPSGLQCSSLHALMSFTTSDEIRDMTLRYLYDANKRLFFYHMRSGALTRFANDWADALDGSIEISAAEATGVIEEYWTGSNPDGALSESTLWDYACLGWTSNADSETTRAYGTTGSRSSLTTWLYMSGRAQCYHTRALLCACKYQL